MKFRLIKIFFSLILILSPSLFSQTDDIGENSSADEATGPLLTPADLPNQGSDGSAGPLTTTDESLSTPANAPLSFVFEMEGGLNVLPESRKNLEKRLDLERLGSEVALSYSFKAGLLFFNNYLVMLSFSYDKLRDYNYKRDVTIEGFKQQVSEKNYGIGVDFAYHFFPFFSKFNFSLLLGNYFSIESIRTTTLEISLSEPADEDSQPEEVIVGFLPPNIKNEYSYKLTPAIRASYRLTDISTIYLSMAYSTLFPSLEHYPIFSLGLQIHFDLSSERKSRKNKSNIRSFAQ